MRVVFNDASFPLVCFHWPKETTDADLQQYLKDSEALLVAKKKHVMLLDMRVYTENSAKQRRMAAVWLKENAQGLQLFRRGVAILFATSEAAATMRLIYRQTPPPYPWFATDSASGATDWLIQQLKLNAMPLPPRLPGI